MLYESEHVRVEAAEGVATLWLEFPGRTVNALSPLRLLELERTLSLMEANPFLDLLVIRSGRPAGFCGGPDPEVLATLADDADRVAYARTGQRILERLAHSPLISIALIEGPCLGPGLELALACDYRLAVGGPDSWLGFPDAPGVPPCWGGSARLMRLTGRAKSHPFLDRGVLVTAREARRLGLVDDAFSSRRARVELRLFLDRLLSRPRKRRAPGEGLGEDLARERADFRAAGPWPGMDCPDSNRPLPQRAAVIGPGGASACLAVELSLRGVHVTVSEDRGLAVAFAKVVRRGRVTPLEADEARQRIAVGEAIDRAELVVVTGSTRELGPLSPGPRTILAVPSEAVFTDARDCFRSHRLIGLDLDSTDLATITAGPETAEDTVAKLGSWIGQLGLNIDYIRSGHRALMPAAA